MKLWEKPNFWLSFGILISFLSWLEFRPWNTTFFMIGAPFGRDFVNFWIGPRLALAGNSAYLADLPAYSRAIMAAFHLMEDPGLIFSYPPHALLFLTPVALLPFVPALLVWTGLNIMALAATVRLCGVQDISRHAELAVATCLSPAAAAMLMYGHFGGLLALGSTFLIVKSDSSPWLAGLCLACISVKPQYAAVLGIVLLCNGRWQCVLVGTCGMFALVGLSIAAYGVDVWYRFFSFTLPLQSALLTEFRVNAIATCTSIYFAMRLWNLPASAAWVVQCGVSVVAIGGAILALRRGRPGPPALAIILLGTIVALPYASHYDVAMAAPVLTILLLNRPAEPTASPLIALAWVLVPLARTLTALNLPVLPLVLAGAVFTQTWRLFACKRSSVFNAVAG